MSEPEWPELRFHPVTQTKFGEGEGNCFASCIATVLGVSLESVPWFVEEPTQDIVPRVNRWLIDTHPHLRYAEFPVSSGVPQLVGSLCILVGKGPRGCGHAVVGQIETVPGGAEVWWKVLHDPHPSRAGLETVTCYGLFIHQCPSILRVVKGQEVQEDDAGCSAVDGGEA